MIMLTAMMVVFMAATMIVMPLNYLGTTRTSCHAFVVSPSGQRFHRMTPISLVDNVHDWYRLLPPRQPQQQEKQKQRGNGSMTRLSLSSSGSASSNNEGEEDSKADPDGAAMAAQLFQMAQAKGVTLNDDDMMDDDDDDDDDSIDNNDMVSSSLDEAVDNDDDDDDDEDDVEPNIPQGAINAFLGYDTGNVGDKLAGKVDLTDDQLYSEVKERVLDTAGGFVDMIRGPSEDDDDDDEGDEDDDNPIGSDSTVQPYQVPSKVPDPELTAGEVVLLVLNAMKHNDEPYRNKGIEILFGYSSSGSQIKNEEGLTPAEYADFLKETEYKVLFEHGKAVSYRWVFREDVPWTVGLRKNIFFVSIFLLNSIVSFIPSQTIDKGDYSFDGQKGFFTARLQMGPQPLDTVSVNFILTSEGNGDDASWLIDSILIRPESMRRRRRR
jgi:hypothetical protein